MEPAAIIETDVERAKKLFVTLVHKTDKSFAQARSNKKETARVALYLIEECKLTHREVSDLAGKDKSYSSRLVKWAKRSFPDDDMWGHRETDRYAEPDGEAAEHQKKQALNAAEQLLHKKEKSCRQRQSFGTCSYNSRHPSG
jgi:hypothetical protein